MTSERVPATTPAVVATKILVTGGVRSGKSAFAEGLLDGIDRVRYVAPGPTPAPGSDPDWEARIAAHRDRRPAGWETVEGVDLAAALVDPPEAVLVDSLGTWVTAVVDDLGTWDEPLPHWQGAFDARLAALLTAWERCPARCIAVGEEVGWGVVPAFRSGRTFADLLGTTTTALAARCDRVVLVVAGRSLEL